MKRPEEQLIMSEEDKFTPLSSILSEESYKKPEEPSVVDGDNKEKTTTKIEDVPNEADKFTPLSDLGKPKPKVEDDNEVENEEEETTEEESDVIENEEEESKSVNIELSEVFDFFVNNNLLNVPEDFKFDGTEEKFNQALQYDQILRDQMAIAKIEQSIQDENIYKLIEHGIAGGKFADVAGLFSAMQQQLNLENVDISNEKQAEDILYKYYTEVNKFTPERARRFVTITKEQDILQEEAKIAVDHYKDFYEKEQVRIDKEAKDKKVYSEKVFQEKVKGVQTAVKELGYSGTVAKNLVTLMAPVIDTDNNNKPVYKDDGQPMLWFEVVLDQIQENPAHLTQLLGLIQGYDPKEGFASIQKQQTKSKESENNKSTFDMFNKIKRTKGGAAVGGENIKYVPPAPNSYETQ